MQADLWNDEVAALAVRCRARAQRARVINEAWAARDPYCPYCGQPRLEPFPANRPVADFFCPGCKAEFELKSSRAERPAAICPDAAYETMMQRLRELNNPSFFFLGYGEESVRYLLFVPANFPVPALIERRKALPSTARRAGWVGCNICLGKIPELGKLPLICQGKVMPAADVLRRCRRLASLNGKSLQSRGWLLGRSCRRIEDLIPVLDLGGRGLYTGAV